MPAASIARDVTHRPARPLGLMESCTPVAGTGHPAGYGRRAGRAKPPRDLICFYGVRTGPVHLKFPQLAILEVPGSQYDLATLPPLWSGMRSAAANQGWDLSYAANISSMAVRDREACEPFLPPSPTSPMPMATPLSLTFSLTMSSAGRIFAAGLREPTRHLFR
jgi:hypothetical protein